MSFTKGQPPKHHAGQMSPLTKQLRPKLRLTEPECQHARRLRRRGAELAEIAARLSAPEHHVRQALATMRTKTLEPSRRSLNVTIAAHDFVKSQAQADEPFWEVVDRLLGELALLRAFIS